MKKLILLLPLFVAACGPSQEEINKKRTQDSLNAEIRKSIIQDSINKVNGARIADSINKEIQNALK